MEPRLSDNHAAYDRAVDDTAKEMRRIEANRKAQRDREERNKLILGICLLIALPVCFWLIPAYFESSAYNRLTGSETTMWDAMFLELRVQEEAK